MRLGLTFDDVLLVPKFSEIKSRKDVNTETILSSTLKLDIPIISANMDTITDWHMASVMHKLGGLGIIHRFTSILSAVRQVNWTRAYTKNVATSVGIGDDRYGRLHNCVEAGANIICLDVAHGDHSRVINFIQDIKSFYPNLTLIAGNVATYDGTCRLADAGADIVKVGIGPGSLCTTRIVTGCGVPQLTAIFEASAAKTNFNISIIADGGIKNSGDIVKAIAAGADAVMIGSLLAGTSETPGELNEGYKTYRGMASRDAQLDWKGTISVVEGETQKIQDRGEVIPIVQQLVDGLRSGMSYCGASNLEELRENAEFIRISSAGLIENKPHGTL